MKVYIKNRQRSTRLNQQRIKRDLSRALHLLGFHDAELSVLFVNSRRMKLLNARHRRMNKVTDVLSFPQHGAGIEACGSAKAGKSQTPGSEVLGDIVICVPQALSQARDYGGAFYDELLRLLLHGLLHLLSYDHEINTYRKRKMEKKERELLYALKAMA